MTTPYDYRNCQSLFGYAEFVHRRSGGVCQLCGCGASLIDFDLWRQFTVEHLIGSSQNGYLKQIRISVAQRFPTFSDSENLALSSKIDSANTVTACSFCNSTTSRDHHTQTMDDMILNLGETADEMLALIVDELATILDNKRNAVRWKIESVRAAFENRIEPYLIDARSQRPIPTE